MGEHDDDLRAFVRAVTELTTLIATLAESTQAMADAVRRLATLMEEDAKREHLRNNPWDRDNDA